LIEEQDGILYTFAVIGSSSVWKCVGRGVIEFFGCAVKTVGTSKAARIVPT
jgi:hypothetical protein